MPDNNVVFDDQNSSQRRSSAQAPVPTGIVGFLVRKGIAKDEKSAFKILIAAMVVMFIATVLIAPGSGKSRSDVSRQDMDDAMRRSLELMQQRR